MQSLSLILSNLGEEGETLPQPFQVFDNLKIRYKRGEVSLVVSAPGFGKSALATYVISRMKYDQDTGVPALYFCADSDQRTVAATILAGFMDCTIEHAEYLIANADPEAFEVLREMTKHVWFCFRRGPDIEDIHTEMRAFAHVHGEYPHMTVIDNLKNIAEDGAGDDSAKYNVVMPALHELAGEANTHVMVLHHILKEYTNGDIPVPRSGIKYAVDDLPALILSLYRPEEGFMGVRILKSRSGRADAKAQYGCDIPWLPERGWFDG